MRGHCCTPYDLICPANLAAGRFGRAAARTGRMRPLNLSISPGHPGNHARADDAGSEHPREGPANLAANRTYRLSLARLREALVKTGLASLTCHYFAAVARRYSYVQRREGDSRAT